MAIKNLHCQTQEFYYEKSEGQIELNLLPKRRPNNAYRKRRREHLPEKKRQKEERRREKGRE